MQVGADPGQRSEEEGSVSTSDGDGERQRTPSLSPAVWLPGTLLRPPEEGFLRHRPRRKAAAGGEGEPRVGGDPGTRFFPCWEHPTDLISLSRSLSSFSCRRGRQSASVGPALAPNLWVLLRLAGAARVIGGGGALFCRGRDGVALGAQFGHSGGHLCSVPGARFCFFRRRLPAGVSVLLSALSVRWVLVRICLTSKFGLPICSKLGVLLGDWSLSLLEFLAGSRCAGVR